jgi:hypothetical protein
MTSPYRVTLVQLKANALGLAPADQKIELGHLPLEEICRLAGNLQLLSTVADPKAEPGIIVYRGDKGWRIAVHGGRLCLHKSTSTFDDYWLAENVRALAELPPFRADPAEPPAARRVKAGESDRLAGLRTTGEVLGLFALGVGLIMVGFWFGLPHKKLSDLPSDIVEVTSDTERATVFSAVAGSYATGKKTGTAVKPGESIVTITPEGRVSLGTMGKDGKPAAPRLQEQARAARKGNLAALVTSFGVIAEYPPDGVYFGSFRWSRLMTN